MVPTYFRRELRDRVLQRRSRLRTFVLLLATLSCPRVPSYPANAGYPVRRGVSVESLKSLEYWITRSSAQLRTRRVMTAERYCMTATLSKADFRTAALAKRDALSDEQRAAAAQAMARHGVPFAIPPGMVVSGYSPIRSEIDPAPLMRKLAEQGAKLALPAVMARGKTLAFRASSPYDPLMIGPLRSLEPSPAAEESIPATLPLPRPGFI